MSTLKEGTVLWISCYKQVALLSQKGCVTLRVCQ